MIKQMTKEELLKPRYKVIADYPYCPYMIGSLVEDTATRFLLTRTNCYDSFEMDIVEQDNYVTEETILKYPHLFKPLNWWEDLKPIEFPKYVKSKHGGIFEVINWTTNPNTAQLGSIYAKEGFLFIEDLLPATKEEYDNQNKVQ